MSIPTTSQQIAAIRTRTTQQCTVPTAYRAWAHWVGILGSAGHQVSQVKWHSDQLTENARVEMLSEVLARATMEVAIGLAFDKMDSRTDLLVREHIRDLFGADVLSRVEASVRAVGPVVTRAEVVL